jgi:chorismate dehydratase
MTTGPVRLGAVGYLNTRPLVCGLDRSPRFSLRFDVPSECAGLLHRGAVDVGLIPSIEYLRGDYCVVPDLAIASRGPVKSVLLFTRKPLADVGSVAMDTSSRTSVALVRVLCARAFGIRPAIEAAPPDLPSMLAKSDAALIIGDNALFLDHPVQSCSETGGSGRQGVPAEFAQSIGRFDLGEMWTTMTGLPFVWAFWAGRAGVLKGDDVDVLQQARDEGMSHIDELAREHCKGDPGRQRVGAAYLRDNIRYHLGPEERAGLERFYRYAAEAGVASAVPELRLF